MMTILAASRSNLSSHVARLTTRYSSTAAADLVQTKIIDESKTAIITMSHAPVNSLSLEMCQSLSSSIQSLCQNPELQAFVLQSDMPAFSAGLDLHELYQPNETRVREFWKAVQQLYLDLYAAPQASIAAITGSAPAAGCMLAMACDYRIMASGGKIKIGLNESQLGIVAPPWMADLMVKCVGPREAEQALMLGRLYRAEEALQVGLVDAVCEAACVQERAHDEAVRWAKIPPGGRVASKLLLRMHDLDHLKNNRENDLDLFLSAVLNSEAQSNLGRYLDSLKKK